jgi:methionine synthase II (cobalamin-independent)
MKKSNLGTSFQLNTKLHVHFCYSNYEHNIAAFQQLNSKINMDHQHPVPAYDQDYIHKSRNKILRSQRLRDPSPTANKRDDLQNKA